jgi:hypothetical protein
MADDFPIGTKVRVKAGIYMRYIDNPDKHEVRLFAGQTFIVDEDDTLEMRTDSAELVEVAKDAPDAPPVEEGAQPDAWGADIDQEALTAQLADLNEAQAKAFLSREEWTLEGMTVAQQAEKDGKDRKSIGEYIEGRLLELEDEPDDTQEG